MRSIHVATLVVGLLLTVGSAVGQQTPEAARIGKLPLAEWLARWQAAATDERAAMRAVLPNREAVRPIAKLLDAPDAAMRELACDLLVYANEDAKELLPQLVLVVKDVEPRVRFAAARVLARLAWPEEQHGPSFTLAMDELIAFARAGDHAIRGEALSCLAGFGGVEPRLVALYADILKEAEVELRRGAVRGLLLSVGTFDDARPLLHDTLADVDARVRVDAARALASAGEQSDEIAAILVGLASDGAEDVRSDAIGALGRLGVERASETLPVLITALQDPSSRVRATAAGTIGNLGSSDDVDAPDAIPLLLGLTKDANADVRGAAAWALGHIGATAKVAVPVLAGLIRDPNAEVRGYALDSLKEADADVVLALPQLIEALDDGAPATRQAVARLIALGGPKSKDAVEALRRRLSDPILTARLWAAYALREIGGAAAPAVARLEKSLAEDPEPRMRVEAARALAAIGPLAGGAADALVAAGRDPELDVRLWSLFALGELQVKSDAVLSALAAAAKSGDESASAEANKALARLGLEHDEGAIAKAHDAPTPPTEAVTTVVHYEEVCIVLSDASGAAAVEFGEEFRRTEGGEEQTGIRYRFRFLAKGQSDVTTGSGELFDSIDAQGQYDVAASRITVEAGALHVAWSQRGRGAGYVYWQPTELCTETVTKHFFESLELRRFIRAERP